MILIKKLIFCCIAFVILSYTIYRRFIVVRLPKELYIQINDVINYSLIIMICISMLVCILQIVLALFIIFEKERKENIFTRFINIFKQLIEDSLYEFYNNVLNLIPNISEKVLEIAGKFYTIFQQQTEALFPFILYTIRFIILLAFFIDVFILFKLQYMYKALYLLGFSLFIKFFIYMLKDFVKNLEELKDCFIITDEIDTETNEEITSYVLKEELKDLDLKYMVSQYIICNKISGYLDVYQRYSNVFTPYINIIIYSSYLIGWFYVIYWNIR